MPLRTITSPWWAGAALGTLVALVVAAVPTVADWWRDPGGIFRGSHGTDWAVVGETFWSWLWPAWLLFVPACLALVWWLRRCAGEPVARWRLVGAIVIALLSAATVMDPRGPMPWSPWAMAVAIPALIVMPAVDGALGESLLSLILSTGLCCLHMPLLFWLWTWPRDAALRVIPRRSIVLLIVVALAQVWWFVDLWEIAMLYHGLGFTLQMLVYNLAAVAGLAVLLRRRNEPLPAHHVATFQVGLFAWISWCAFPWITALL